MAASMLLTLSDTIASVYCSIVVRDKKMKKMKKEEEDKEEIVGAVSKSRKSKSNTEMRLSRAIVNIVIVVASLLGSSRIASNYINFKGFVDFYQSFLNNVVFF